MQIRWLEIISKLAGGRPSLAKACAHGPGPAWGPPPRPGSRSLPVGDFVSRLLLSRVCLLAREPPSSQCTDHMVLGEPRPPTSPSSCRKREEFGAGRQEPLTACLTKNILVMIFLL